MTCAHGCKLGKYFLPHNATKLVGFVSCSYFLWSSIVLFVVVFLRAFVVQIMVQTVVNINFVGVVLETR